MSLRDGGGKSISIINLLSNNKNGAIINSKEVTLTLKDIYNRILDIDLSKTNKDILDWFIYELQDKNSEYYETIHEILSSHEAIRFNTALGDKYGYGKCIPSSIFVLDIQQFYCTKFKCEECLMYTEQKGLDTLIKIYSDTDLSTEFVQWWFTKYFNEDILIVKISSESKSKSTTTTPAKPKTPGFFDKIMMALKLKKSTKPTVVSKQSNKSNGKEDNRNKMVPYIYVENVYPLTDSHKIFKHLQSGEFDRFLQSRLKNGKTENYIIC